MPRVPIRPREFHNPGEWTFPPFPIPIGATRIKLFATRDNLPVRAGGRGIDKKVLLIRVEVSYDGGTTWRGYLVGSPGGAHFTFRGALQPEITVGPGAGMLREPNNPNRLGRVVINVRMRLRTQLDVDIE